MNDRPPPGNANPPAPAPDAFYAHHAPYGQQGGPHGYADTGTYGTTGTAYDTGTHGGFGNTPDPLFGDFPGTPDGRYDTSSPWQTGHTGQDTGTFDTRTYNSTGSWTMADHQAAADVPAQDRHHSDTTGQWDADAWHQGRAGQYATGTYDTSQWSAPAYGSQDTGSYDATQWNTAGADTTDALDDRSAGHDQHAHHDPYAPYAESAPYARTDHSDDHASYTARHDTPEQDDEPLILLDPEGPLSEVPESDASSGPDLGLVPRRSGGRAAARTASRSRRRAPAKRSALLTVAVPSVCVLGAAGIAAASVGTGGANAQEDVATQAAAAVKPSVVNNEFDAQVIALDTEARDFGDRANRTQERIDLKARQAAARKAKEEEAARIEAARPKFVLPVKQHGLSAYYGQAGINWMSVHSGIDFPVSYGTPVMAATDGTVRTQWNGAYGNMAIVTAADGTETWYCHLSSTKIRSGSVKAGDVIAYSGNSGNSTGPHLHFEVRPGGGTAIDPLTWLRGHGVNPT